MHALATSTASRRSSSETLRSRIRSCRSFVITRGSSRRRSAFRAYSIDEIGATSYTKGCYTGQETVSRLHFRGHANRHLRGLLFESDPPAAPASGWSAVTQDEREVGRVTSIAWLPDGGGSVLGRWIGLAIVRREVPIGATVRAAGREARIVDLPFDVPKVTPA